MAGVPKYGDQINTNLRCKICSSPNRAEIEDAICLRLQGEVLPTGERPSIPWIERNSLERWGVMISKKNIDNHLRSHFAIWKQTPGQQEKAAVVVQRNEQGHVASDDFLDLVIDAGAAKIVLDPSKVTIDHALKAVTEKTRRKTDDAMNEVLKAMAGATSKAVSKIPDPEPKQVDVEILEAEVVEVVEAEGS